MKNCKQCGNKNPDPNAKFCNRKCKKSWQLYHEVKGAKKFYSDIPNRLLDQGITGRGVFDYKGNV